MPKYYIKISGGAFGIEGTNKDEAIASIQKITDVFCSFNALEIGVDCDEFGWEIPKAKIEVKK